MPIVNSHETTTHQAISVERTSQGESFIVAKAVEPVVSVVAIEAEPVKKPQRLGFMKGKMRVPEDFDAMYAKEIEDTFYDDSKLMNHRSLLAQAIREDLTLVTSDEILASYPGPILKV